MRINNEQRERFLRKVRSMLWTLKGKRLAVLGLAFKGGTDDVRESPAISVIRSLIDEGCKIQAYDPAATDNARQAAGHGKHTVRCVSNGSHEERRCFAGAHGLGGISHHRSGPLA